MQEKLNHRVATATKWSALAEIFAKIAAPIVNSVLARLLDPEMFGVVASITIVTSFADIFTDAGFQKYVIQHEYPDEASLNRDANVAFTSNLTLSTIIYLCIFLFRKQLAKAVGCPEAFNALAVAAIMVLCTSFSSINIARFRRELDFKPLFYVRLGSSIIPLVVTVPLAFVLKSYWALVFGTLAQQLFIAVVTFAISKNKPCILFDFSNFKGMLSFSAWNLCETMSIWFAGQANIFIVANTLTAYYLGLYRNGMTTINSYMAIVTAAVTPVLFSALSRTQNNQEEYQATFSRFQKGLGILILPMGVGIFVYRELAVKILLGSKWLAISNFMGLWALMSACTITLSNVACEVYRSQGKPKVSFVLQVVYLIFYIPVIYYSAHAGFEILCLWACLIRLVPIIFDIITLKFKFKIKPSIILNNLWYSGLAAIVMGLAGFGMRKLSDSIVWQLCSVGICVLLYLGMQVANPKMRKEIKDLRGLIKK